MATNFKNVLYNDAMKKFIVSFSFDNNLVLSLKTKIPQNRRWYDVPKRQWQVDINSAKELLEWCLAHQFTIGGSAQRIFDEHQVKKPMELVRLPDLKIEIPLKMPLFPYQAQGVAYNLQHKNVLIGDTMGLGKSVQALASVVGMGELALPCLIVCPAHLKYNWLKEINMWTDMRGTIMYDGMRKHALQHFQTGFTKFAIVNYDSLPKHFASEMVRDLPDPETGKPGKVKEIKLNGLEKHFKSIIIDEVHLASNHQTQRYKILEQIKDLPMVMRLALSGTPIKNKVSEIMYVLNLINALENFGGKKQFSSNYLTYKKIPVAYGFKDGHKVPTKYKFEEGSTNEEDLQVRLRNTCYYRREKHEVLKDLPDKFRQVIKLDIDNRKEYQYCIDHFKEYLATVRNKSEESIMRSLRAAALTCMMQLIQISARGKMKQIIEWVEETIDQGEKVVIFHHHQEIGDMLHNRFSSFVRISGGMSAEAKDKAVQSFQNDKNTMGIIVSILAGSTGLTLTASSIVALIELPWTAEKTDQCEDRCHRIGAKDTVNAYYFLGNDTIDEHQYDTIQAKRTLANSVTGADERVEVNVQQSLMKNLFNLN